MYRHLLLMASVLMLAYSASATGSVAPLDSPYVDTSNVVMDWKTAEYVDQWIQDSRGAYRRAVSAILAKKHEAINLNAALVKGDTALARSQRQLDLYVTRDVAMSDENKKQRKQLNRQRPVVIAGWVAIVYAFGRALYATLRP